jgi:hypothetical protein
LGKKPMRTAFIINLCAFGLSAMFGIVAAFFEVDRVNAAIQQFPLSVVFFLPLMAFGLSAIYLLLQSWVMLIRFWKGRGGSENLKLLLLLCFFSFLAAYYFYWKRADIDPHAA